MSGFYDVYGNTLNGQRAVLQRDYLFSLDLISSSGNDSRVFWVASVGLLLGLGLVACQCCFLISRARSVWRRWRSSNLCAPVRAPAVRAGPRAQQTAQVARQPSNALPALPGDGVRPADLR